MLKNKKPLLINKDDAEELLPTMKGFLWQYRL